MRRFDVAAVLFPLVLLHAVVAEAEWIIDAEGGLVYEDNLNRATRQADRKSDIALVPAGSIGYYFQLTDATSLLASADFKGSVYPHYDRLSNLAATVTLGVRHKFGLGAFAPWVRVFATGGALDYGDDVRDSAVVDFGFQVGKRLWDRFELQGGYVYESLDAGNGVFDGESHTVSLKGNIGLTDAIQLILGYAVRWGDLVVHRAATPGAALPPHSRIVDTFDTPMLALRIDATTHLFSAAASYAFTPHAALTLGYQYQHSIGPVFEYPNNVVRLSFGYSF